MTEAVIRIDDREVRGERVFNAPRELVWKAWTHPDHLARWWGPQGFTTTTNDFELRPGGVWRFVMHGPDGRDYHNRIVFDEVQAPERLVYRHVPEPGTDPVRFDVTVTFEAEGERTRILMRMVFESADERERVDREYGANEGLRQTLDRLAAFVTLR